MGVFRDHRSSARETGATFVWVLAVVLFAIGVFARGYDLESLPKFIHNDESATAIYVTPPFIKTPPDPIMWGQNNYGGHANFGAWLASLSVMAFGGKTLWAIRMGSMVCGVLSILFGALFVRSWLGLRGMVLFLVGVVPFHLHVHFSRTGFIYIQAVLLLSIVAFIFGQFARRPSFVSALLLGIATGLALMVYSVTHVLLGVIPLSVLAVLWSRRNTKGSRIQKVVKGGGLIVTVCIGLSISFGQFAYHAYNQGFSSRLEQQSIFRDEVRQDISRQLGREVSNLEVLEHHMATTLSFFWAGDSSVQYGLVRSPLPLVASWILVLGLIVLVFRCCAIDPFAVFVAALACGTLVGSGLMVERNFAPHLVAFGLILPFLSALAIESIVRLSRVTSLTLTGLLAIALFIPWARWNYELYTELDRQKRNLDTFVLHLPIERAAVRKIINYTDLTMDVKESFYMLQYPNAQGSKNSVVDMPTQILTILGAGECPCLVVVPEERGAELARLLAESRRGFREFSFEPNREKIVYME